jgi:hypothetical protein
MEDGPALLELFRSYRPLFTEKGFLLLRRLPRPSRDEPADRPVLCQRTVTFGEEVDLSGLPSGAQVAALRLTDAVRGRVGKLLYKPPPLYLVLTLEDGRTVTRRLIPALAASGFLLNPLLETDEDVLRLYRREPLPRVRALAVRADPGTYWCYQDRVEVTVRLMDDVP